MLLGKGCFGYNQGVAEFGVPPGIPEGFGLALTPGWASSPIILGIVFSFVLKAG